MTRRPGRRWLVALRPLPRPAMFGETAKDLLRWSVTPRENGLELGSPTFYESFAMAASVARLQAKYGVTVTGGER